jgi:lysophospholipase L1-like esterase
MIRILCYGDSNTWGFNPAEPFARLPHDVHWEAGQHQRFAEAICKKIKTILPRH